jgi:hypothetical protein
LHPDFNLHVARIIRLIFNENVPISGKEPVTIRQEEHIRVLEECKAAMKDPVNGLKVDVELMDKLKHDQVITGQEIEKIEVSRRILSSTAGFPVAHVWVYRGVQK